MESGVLGSPSRCLRSIGLLPTKEVQPVKITVKSSVMSVSLVFMLIFFQSKFSFQTPLCSGAMAVRTNQITLRQLFNQL